MEKNDMNNLNNDISEQGKNISAEEYQQFLEFQKFQQYQQQNEQSYKNDQYDNAERCPHCGSTDLLYETVQNNRSHGSVLKTVLIIITILTPIIGGATWNFDLMFIGTIGMIIFDLIIFAVLKSDSGEKDGTLRVTCKRCGKRVR